MAKVRRVHFDLHPDIDIEAASRRYRRDRRVTIKPFVFPAQAERLRDHLLGRTDWRLRLKGEGEKVYDLGRNELEAWTPVQRDGLRKLVAPVADDSFCYAYEQIVVQADERGTILADFTEFLSSACVIEMVGLITGDVSVSFADTFASRYGPSDFLTVHRDSGGNDRIAAYVVGLTTRWRPDWGGLLQFHREDGNIALGLSPDFNVFNLFAVPQDHSVSMVAPFAPEPRLSVSGWFRRLQASGSKATVSPAV